MVCAVHSILFCECSLTVRGDNQRVKMLDPLLARLVPSSVLRTSPVSLAAHGAAVTRKWLSGRPISQPNTARAPTFGSISTPWGNNAIVALSLDTEHRSTNKKGKEEGTINLTVVLNQKSQSIYQHMKLKQVFFSILVVYFNMNQLCQNVQLSVTKKFLISTT